LNLLDFFNLYAYLTSYLCQSSAYNIKEHDLLLWNGQNQFGNIWQSMADKIFKGEWHSDKIRNRWYSQPFKDFIASKFGKNAYEEAQAKGKQINSGGRVSLSGKKRGRGDGPLIVWTSDTDNKLWKAQNELGNRWREVAVKLGRPNNLDQIKSRWYSDKFKDFVAREFGKGAYKEAHVAGKQQRTGAKPQIDWTEEDDKLLWQSRLELGNKWGDISSIKFENRITENLVKNRWYSTAFKNFVASEYGPNAYQQAKISRRGPTCQVTWTEEDDAMLWKLHQEIGNKWDEMEDRYFKEQNITEMQIKNRWYSQPFKRYVAQNFGQDAH